MMKHYQGWDGRHFRNCELSRVWGTEEDFQLHLDVCNPETCEEPHPPCECADRDESAYWREVDRRVDELRGK